MQHRVNRWLSTDLIPDPEAVQIGRVTFRPIEGPAPDGPDFTTATYIHSASRARARRKTWQRVAAAALLAGSAAFSYVAWSQGQSFRIVDSSLDFLSHEAADPRGAAPPSTPSDDERLQALRRDQVYLLRQENQLLRERVTALKTRVRNGAPAH